MLDANSFVKAVRDNIHKDLSVDEDLLSVFVCGPFECAGSVIYRKRHLVEARGRIRLTINSNEHPPPHFHVDGPDIAAAFAIMDCSLVSGRCGPRMHPFVLAWHRQARPKLIRIWNETRPSGCSVGAIKEDQNERS